MGDPTDPPPADPAPEPAPSPEAPLLPPAEPTSRGPQLVVLRPEAVIRATLGSRMVYVTSLVRSCNRPPVRVAVNLSAAQFLRRDLVASVLRALNVGGLAPEHLELEITEGLLMRDTTGTVATLRRLADLGVSLHGLATWWDVLGEAEASGAISGFDLAEVRRFLEAPEALTAKLGG